MGLERKCYGKLKNLRNQMKNKIFNLNTWVLGMRLLEENSKYKIQNPQ